MSELKKVLPDHNVNHIDLPYIDALRLQTLLFPSKTSRIDDRPYCPQGLFSSFLRVFLLLVGVRK